MVWMEYLSMICLVTITETLLRNLMVTNYTGTFATFNCRKHFLSRWIISYWNIFPQETIKSENVYGL